ncbi:MAG: hypothetical protein JW891_18245 [Candidatus Lokiarchaeota archaeon]|nr:hypothetical protein [Candidatus Lokiarchaeota archaeon]
MSEKVPKNEFLIIDEEGEIEGEEGGEEEAEDEEVEERDKKGLSADEIDQRRRKNEQLKDRRKKEREKKEQDKIRIKGEIKQQVIKLLNKGKISSKESLTNLLIKAGIKDYYYKTNLLTNQLKPEIEHIGASLKELRFDKEVNFRIVDGAHVYYKKNLKKEVKSKKHKAELNWRSYKIPEGNNEIHVILKIPGSYTDSRHFLSSCFPQARFWGFTITVDKKYNETHGFKIISENILGRFDGDMLLISCRTSEEGADKTLYKLIQIGRNIIVELIKLNWRYSEFLVINNLNDTIFIPTIIIFRARDRKAFYETKFVNALRIVYDFPQKFDKKDVFGKYSVLSKEQKDDQFDLKSYYEFIHAGFLFQTKSFLTNAILNDWIINPTKVLNYTEQDEDMTKLIKEYAQDIETDRIIKERLEEKMQKGEFLKEMTTNLLLTLLGVSFWADTPWLQGGVIAVFISINIFYVYLRAKRTKKKVF